MQVTLETTSSLERKMRISVPAEQVETKVAAKLKQAAGQVRINGFRPGKVPMREVKRRFGEGIRQEVSSELMQSSFSEALQQEAVAPAGTPQIEEVSMEAGRDLEFTAVFEVFPEIVLGDFSSLSVEKPVAEIAEADITLMIEKLQTQRVEYVEVDRVSQAEDKVNVDFEGSVDGEVFEGGQATGNDIILGSGSMIPGFEEGLIGCRAGDEKEISLSFPETYQAENLAGKAAVFKVKVHKVLAAEKPAVDEEFFKLFGVEEGGLDAFKAELSTNMGTELESAVKNKVKTQVMDGLLATTEVELPKALISAEIDRMRKEAVQQFGGGDSIDPSVLPAEMFEKQAQRRVKLGLIMNAIVDQMALKADDTRVKEAIESMAKSYEEPEQVINYYYNNEQQLNQIQNMVLEEQVIDTILEKATVVEMTMSYDDAIKPAPSPAIADDSVSDEAASATNEDGQA